MSKKHRASAIAKNGATKIIVKNWRQVNWVNRSLVAASFTHDLQYHVYVLYVQCTSTSREHKGKGQQLESTHFWHPNSSALIISGNF